MTYNFKLNPTCSYYSMCFIDPIHTTYLCFSILPFPIREALEISSFGGPVVYKVQLPKDLSIVHNMFHISQLKKCFRVLKHVIGISDVNLGPDLTYLEYSIKVLDQKDRSLEEMLSSFISYSGTNPWKMKPHRNWRSIWKSVFMSF
jgi:hypothetical protein